MPVIRLSTKSRNAMLDGLAARLDAGGEERPGTISLFEGAMPADPDAGPGDGKLLAYLPFGYPAFRPASLGIAESFPIGQQNALATGRARWARLADGLGNVVLDGDVGTEAKSGPRPFVVLNTVDIFIGGPVILKSAKLRLPEN